MADVAALDLRWRSGPGADETRDRLHAQLDDFEPQAIHDHESCDGWRVFFRTFTQRDDAAQALGQALGDRLLTVTPVDVADDEWARRSQANLTPVRVGRIVVSPPWHEPDGSHRLPDYDLQPQPLSIGRSADILIIIDPSTGFGTGHHETTRLCLWLLQSVALDGRQVIDVGTGSGVLAIAAAKLGAAAVIALDEDPEALRNARENVTRNKASEIVDVRQADLVSFQAAPAGVVVANLTGAVIQKHAARLVRLVEPGGSLIVSGFSTDEADEVARALAPTVERQLTEGDWVAVRLRPLRPGLTGRRT